MEKKEKKSKEEKTKQRRSRGSITECLDFTFSLEGKEAIGRALYLALMVLEKIPPTYVCSSQIENMEYLREVVFGEGFERARREFQFLESVRIDVTPYNEYLEQVLKQKGGQNGEII